MSPEGDAAIAENQYIKWSQRPLRETLLGQEPLNFNVVLYGQQGRNSYAENLTTVDLPFTVKIPMSILIEGGVESFTPKNVRAIYIGMQSTGTTFATSYGIKRIWFD